MTEKNWGGNLTYSASSILRPASTNELVDVISSAPHVRIVGSRHSFNDIGDAPVLVDLHGLPERFEFDPDHMTVTVDGAMTYGRFAELARPHDIALHNLASLPHISIAGAIATATHGSGTANGNLSTAVVALEVVSSSGETVRTRRGEPDFDGMVVGLGALGAVTAITLEVQPAFRVEQHVFERIEWQTLLSSFSQIMSAGYSVSAFTRYGDDVEQLWFKLRSDAEPPALLDGFAGTRATQHRHPIIKLDAHGCTRQLGEPGLWSDRLPHFQLAFSPSAGDEIQSEFFVPADKAVDAIEALRSARDRFGDVLLVGEIRSIAADRLWMSPHFDRASVGFHFTWKLDPEAAGRAASAVADALDPFAVRPHWGKVFPFDMVDTDAIAHFADFVELVERIDTRQAFRNRWLARLLG